MTSSMGIRSEWRRRRQWWHRIGVAFGSSRHGFQRLELRSTALVLYDFTIFGLSSESWLVLRYMMFSSGELKPLVTLPRSTDSNQNKAKNLVKPKLNLSTNEPSTLPSCLLKNSIPCDEPGNVAHYLPTIHCNISLFVDYLALGSPVKIHNPHPIPKPRPLTPIRAPTPFITTHHSPPSAPTPPLPLLFLPPLRQLLRLLRLHRLQFLRLPLADIHVLARFLAVGEGVAGERHQLSEGG